MAATDSYTNLFNEEDALHESLGSIPLGSTLRTVAKVPFSMEDVCQVRMADMMK